jgi:hypothetical protein
MQEWRMMIMSACRALEVAGGIAEAFAFGKATGRGGDL